MDRERGPIVFLDVDGPLNPFQAKPTRRPAGYRTYRMRPSGWESSSVDPLRVWLKPGHGEQILALPGEIVWATTWGDDANRWIGPEIGLPALPVVRWPEEPWLGEGVFWKTRPLVEWAAGRAFVWIDDAITHADLAFVQAVHDGPALLHRVDPAVGLLDEDFEMIDHWLRRLGEPGEPGQ